MKYNEHEFQKFHHEQLELAPIEPPSTYWQIFKSDYRNFVLLLFLYTIQNIIYAYPAQSMTFDLIRNGASMNDFAIISIFGYPFSFKFLWAPLLDKFYINSIGRRKTYVIFSQLSLIILYFILAFFIETLLSNLDIIMLTIIFFITNFILTFQSIAIDSWSITLLDKQNIPYASLFQNIGQIFGQMISYNIYLYLSSPSFCKDYFNSSPIITARTLMFLTLISLILLTFYIYFYIEEQDSINVEDCITWKETFSLMKEMSGHLNYQYLFIFLLLFDCGFAPIEDVGLIYLIKNKFPQQNLALMNLVYIIPQLLFNMLISYYNSKGLFFKLYYIAGFGVRVFADIYMYFIIQESFNPNYSIETITIHLYIYNAFAVMCTVSIQSCLYSFMLTITHSKIEATFITIWACFFNFGTAWDTTYSMAMIHYVSFENLSFGMLIFGIIVHGLLFKKLSTFDFEGRDDFQLGIDKNEKKADSAK